MDQGVPRIPVGQVLDSELEQIRASRLERLETEENRRDPATSLIGLAFSGGGIRSATFNLGVLQGLARLGLLRKFDYLSTVSGGGYIGSWLMAWMDHQHIDEERFENYRHLGYVSALEAEKELREKIAQALA